MSNFRIFLNQMSILWIGGLGISILFLLRLTLDLNVENSDWIQYYSLVFVFPVLVLAITIKGNSNFMIIAKLVLSSIFIFFGTYYFYDSSIFIISIVSSIIIFLFSFWKEHKNTLSNYIFILSKFLLLTISWFFAFKIYWWATPGDNTFYRTYSYCIFFIAFILVLLSFFKISWLKLEKLNQLLEHKNILFYLGFLFAILIFGYTSLRYGNIDLHHWGCYIGPAQMVRQGGWLLWSVPSQYGFLSILSIAIFPMKSCYQSLYILSSFFQFATALIIFYTLYSLRENIINYFLALFLTISSLFLFPGWVPSLKGVQAYPSIGPYRFFWIFALIFFIFIQYKKDLLKNEYKKIAIGTSIWLIGFLWSFESAFYVSAVWFPYLLVNSLNISTQKSGTKNIFLRKILIGISIAVCALLFTSLFISSLYYFKFDELPDFESFYENAVSFKEGFGSIIINPLGSVSVALLVVFIITASISQNLLGLQKNKEKIAILTALYFGLIATLTYFVSRSHENNISNLMPVMIFTLATVLSLEKEKFFINYYKLAILPIYIAVLALTYGSPYFTEYRKDIKGYSSSIEKELPKENNYSEVMKMAGIKDHESVSLIDDMILFNREDDQVNQEQKNWLPLNPCTVVNPLNDTRIETYIQRFSAQFKSGGYLITNKEWFFYPIKIRNQLLKYYTPIRTVYENEKWLVEIFTYKPDYFLNMFNKEVAQIKADRKWYEAIKKKSILNNTSIKKQLFEDALYMLESRKEINMVEIKVLKKQLELE
jgi:hypothetical protein